jgi:hypothetical protein
VLFEDHEKRKRKNLESVERVNKAAQDQTQIRKTNSNSHQLALQKLEKDLVRLLSLLLRCPGLKNDL